MSPTGQIPAKFYTRDFSENLSRKYKFFEHRTKISGGRWIYIKTYVRFILLALMYVAEQKQKALLRFQDKAYNMYHTVEGDIYTSTIQTLQSSILLRFFSNNGYAKEPRCYFLHTSPFSLLNLSHRSHVQSHVVIQSNECFISCRPSLTKHSKS